MLQAWLCFLPALVLAWPGPGAFLRDDFVPQSTGAGAAALLSIPAACLLVLRRAAPAVRGLTLYLVPLVVGVAWISLGTVSDTFESSRVMLGAFTGLVMLLSGASLREGGRRILARGAVCIALFVLVSAHSDRENGWTGVLGNTGAVSEAALAGALVGAFFALRESTGWRLLGAAALLLHVAYTARVPVIAGALALAAALATAALFARALPRAGRIVCGAVACAALLGPLIAIAWSRAAAVGEARERGAATASSMVAGDESARAAGDASARVALDAGGPDDSEGLGDPGDTGGIEVRARIWSASLHMLWQRALAGVGPGQFAAAFPAYRDPREIELTTLARRLPSESEVEHPHNDWLAPALDAGVVAGLCWIAFLIAVVRRGARSLGGGDASLMPLAAAALGVCANAFVGATLSANSVSSSLAFAIFGCVLAEAGAERSVLARRFVALGAAALLVVHAPRALALLRHGRALHPLAAAPAAETQSRALETALDACPDSVLALRLRARRLEADRRDPALIHDEWLRVLSARPQHIEALMQLGLLAVKSGEPARARPYYTLALELDGEHPGLLQNLIVLEFETGNVAAGLDYLERLSRRGPPSEAWLTDLAARLYLRGQEHEADVLMRRVQRELVQLRAEEAHARAKTERRNDHVLLADALESHAQRTWAREHMQAERYADAVRLYRQDLRITRDYVEGGALRMRLELAAALLAAGKTEDAKAEAGALRPEPADWEALPSFASGRLRATGWFPQ